jgi:hypothetical protein
MDRVKLLCAMNRTMLQDFSQRTVEGLKKHRLFRLALLPFQTFLDINVDKEVEKDRTVIPRAAGLHQSATRPEPAHVVALLQKARQIDQTFLRDATVFPVEIKIQYQDIEQYRQRRIELLLQTSYDILVQWQGVTSFRVAIKRLYNEAQFRELIHNLLELYARETRMLSHSVSIPNLLALARDSVTQTVSNVMKQEAETLAKSLAHRVYQR